MKMHVSRIGLKYKGCIGRCEYFVNFVHICIMSALFMMSMNYIYCNILWNVQ